MHSCKIAYYCIIYIVFQNDQQVLQVGLSFLTCEMNLLQSAISLVHSSSKIQLFI